jgi:hypothetical protein
MLERMESPKLRSFEEVPYVEMDHRHAPKQPETFGKADQHFLAIRAVTRVMFGARLLGRLIS